MNVSVDFLQEMKNIKLRAAANMKQRFTAIRAEAPVENNFRDNSLWKKWLSSICENFTAVSAVGQTLSLSHVTTKSFLRILWILQLKQGLKKDCYSLMTKILRQIFFPSFALAFVALLTFANFTLKESEGKYTLYIQSMPHHRYL